MGFLEIIVYFENAPIINDVLEAVKKYIQHPIEYEVGVDNLLLNFYDSNKNKSQDIFFDVDLFFHLKEHSEESVFDRVTRTQKDNDQILQEMRNIFSSNQLHKKRNITKKFDEIVVSSTIIPNYLLEVVLMILIDMGGLINDKPTLPQWAYSEWKGVEWWNKQKL